MKRKILHLIGSNCVGGPEKQILHHAVDMQGSPYEIEVGSFHDLAESPEILREAEKRGVGTVCFDGAVRPHLVGDLVTTLAERSADLLCTHGFKANVLGYLASRRSKTPHVAFLRGWTAETARVRFYEVLEREALARAQNVVCVSRKQAAQVTRLRGRRGAPLVIENAMLPPFARAGLAPAPSRAELGIAPEAFVFGSVGRLSAEKGHRYLIEAFAQLCSTMEMGTLHLIVVGDGREQPVLERQAEQLGIAGAVSFVGFQGNCAEWMERMDCMVQPSLTEGTPNSVLEAFCVGLPVIATAVGGVPDLITDRENGLLVPPAQSALLAGAMRELSGTPSLRTSLVDGAAHAKKEYSTARQRERLVALYEQVAPVRRQG